MSWRNDEDVSAASAPNEIDVWMPDGTEAKTVADVAVLMGVTEQEAAERIVTARTAPSALLAAAKDIHAGSGAQNVTVGVGAVLERARTVARGKRKRKRKPKLSPSAKEISAPDKSEYSNSVCVMLQYAGAESVAIEGGLAPEDLHVTLCWYGDIDRQPQGEDYYLDALTKIAGTISPFVVSLNGITRFSTPNSAGKDPLVVNVDSPTIEVVRHLVVDALGAGASEHGFTPHTTIGYIDKEDPLPIQRYEPISTTITGVLLAWGTNLHYIPLGKEEF